EFLMLNTKGNRITYFGHSTFSLTTPSGQVALIDPWVTTNPWCPEALKKLSRLDAIFLTHAHTDHLGDLLALAKQFRPKIAALFGDMKLIGELYMPDLAMLPIGDRFTMGPGEAAYAIRLLGVKHVVPMHYATFPFLTGTAEALRKEAKKIKGLKIYALKPGEKL